MNSFMPTGRTSLIEVDSGSLQVQTEYAYRPYPRITTTVLNQGEVLHKIEKKLDQPISSQEEQARIQDFIGRQHSAVLDTIRESGSEEQDEGSKTFTPPDSKVNDNSLDEVFDLKLPFFDRISRVAGVQRVYHLDVEGRFVGRLSDEQFRKEFSKVFKNLREVMSVFALGAGGLTRERGVYEVERDRLYFVSAETECFFVSIRRTDGETVYEKVLQQAIERRNELRV